MDAALKLLADASIEAAAAEEAADAGAWTTARDRLDAGHERLQSLRESWALMAAGQRAVVGPAARQVRDRLDAAEGRLPRRTALVDVPAETDPEQDTAPA